MQNFKFFLRIIFIIFLTFFMTYLITMVTTIYISSNKFNSSLKNEFQYLLIHKNEEFNLQLKNIYKEINQLLKNRDIEAYSLDKNTKKIENVLSNHLDTFSKIYFTNKEGKLVINIRRNETQSYLQLKDIKAIADLAQKYNGIRISNIEYIKKLNKSIIIFSALKRNQNENIIGKFYFIVPVEKLIKNAHLGLNDNYTLRIIDENNKILLSSKKDEISKKLIVDKKLVLNTFENNTIMGQDSFYSKIQTPFGYMIISSKYDDLNQLIIEYIYSISLIYLLIFTIALLIMYILIKQAIKPIKRLAHQIEEYSLGNFEYKVKVESNDEINMVANVFNSLGDELQTNRKKLLDINNNLEKRVEEEVNINIKKEKVILEQSKLAAMGQMIDAIAHQWKQPLSVIKTISSGINIQNEFGTSTKEFISDGTKNIQEQIDSLVETIDEFRSFFRPNQKKEKVNIKNIIEKVIQLEKSLLTQNKIITSIQGDDTIEYELIPAEFKHVFINLISNAKDAFIENHIKNKKINFKVENKEEKTIITIEDTAGGIPSDVIENIFDINFTTKEEGKGTGVGLHMSKQIVDKLKGSISVINIEYEDEGEIQKGARFTIVLD